jgi:succinate dehydrogenase / fumarate reductase cytochrome b subunit
MAKSALLKSSIAKKVAMALSGILMFSNLALFFHSFGFSRTLSIRSHFMGNPLVQFVIQPILIVGVIFHFIGFVLDFKIEARPIAMQKNNGGKTLLGHQKHDCTGSVILAFFRFTFL